VTNSTPPQPCFRKLTSSSYTASAHLKSPEIRSSELRVVERTQTHTNPEGVDPLRLPSLRRVIPSGRGMNAPTHTAQRSSLFAAYTLRCPGNKMRYNACVHTVFIRLRDRQPKVNLRRAHSKTPVPRSGDLGPGILIARNVNHPFILWTRLTRSWTAFNGCLPRSHVRLSL
jgi:hypothetical protein